MSTKNFKKVQYPWALSLDKLDAAQNALIEADIELTEEAVKEKYIEMQGSLPAEASTPTEPADAGEEKVADKDAETTEPADAGEEKTA